MAGTMSAEVNAKLLILNHISPKADYVNQDEESAQLSLIEKAKEGSKYFSEVIMAYDFMEVLVPWLGFGTANEQEETNVGERPEENLKSSWAKAGSVDAKKVLKDWFGSKV